ncbi:hypothetical protein IWX65_003144 [Arthrobacter sp. CAN_A214]
MVRTYLAGRTIRDEASRAYLPAFSNEGSSPSRRAIAASTVPPVTGAVSWCAVSLWAASSWAASLSSWSKNDRDPGDEVSAGDAAEGAAGDAVEGAAGDAGAVTTAASAGGAVS